MELYLPTLHSNMFLLIPRSGSRYIELLRFTFQYVSINTNAARYASQLGYAFTFQYVSINTGLGSGSGSFTFQYVSINTH